jgi:hypothetical protein
MQGTIRIKSQKGVIEDVNLANVVSVLYPKADHAAIIMNAREMNGGSYIIYVKGAKTVAALNNFFEVRLDMNFSAIEETTENKMESAGIVKGEEIMKGLLPNGKYVYVRDPAYYSAPEAQRDNPEFWQRRAESGALDTWIDEK